MKQDNTRKYCLNPILESTTNKINEKETVKNSAVSIENSDSIPNDKNREVFILLTIKLCNTKKFKDNKNSIIEGVDKVVTLVDK